MSGSGPSTPVPFAISAALLVAVFVAPPAVRARDMTVSPVALRGTPPEIAAFLRRRAGCNRLQSEDGEDPGRVADTVKSRFWMKCSTVDDDERRLRARYANSPAVIDALDQNGEADSADN